jgi:hypothetical protein
MTSLEPHYRFLALSVGADELAEVYAMAYEAEQQFRAEGVRDLSDQWRTTTIEHPPAA